MLLASGISATSCKSGSASSKQQATNQTTDTLVTDSVTYSYANSDSSVMCTMKVDWPTGSDSLSLTVRDFIDQQLAQIYLPYSYCEESEQKSYPTYNGDTGKIKEMVDFYGNGTVRLLKKIWKDVNTDSTDDEKTPVSCETRITKTAETDRYLTYDVFCYSEPGGHHGSLTAYSINISKVDNKVITQCVDTTRLTDLQPLLRKGLLEYFKGGGDLSVTEQNLNESIFIKDGIIPLPVSQPYFAKDGVHFVYQQEEIGPYSMGMPGFVIPFNEIKPFLTPEAQKML